MANSYNTPTWECYRNLSYIAYILQQSDFKITSFCLDHKLQTTGD